MGANHLVTLVNDATTTLAAAGVEEPQRLLAPLLSAALDNVLRLGDARADRPGVARRRRYPSRRTSPRCGNAHRKWSRRTSRWPGAPPNARNIPAGCLLTAPPRSSTSWTLRNEHRPHASAVLRRPLAAADAVRPRPDHGRAARRTRGPPRRRSRVRRVRRRDDLRQPSPVLGPGEDLGPLPAQPRRRPRDVRGGGRRTRLGAGRGRHLPAR